MSNQPHTIYWIDNQTLYLRFEGVEYSDFFIILQKFKSRIPDAVWDSRERAWRLSRNLLQEVAVFSYFVFGQNSMCLRGARPPRQLILPEIN